MATPSESPRDVLPAPRLDLLRRFTRIGLPVTLLAIACAWIASFSIVHTSFLAMERDEADSIGEDLVTALAAHDGPGAPWAAGTFSAAAEAEVRAEMANFGIIEFTLLRLDGTPRATFAAPGVTPQPAWPAGLRTARDGGAAVRWEGERSWPLLLVAGPARGALETVTPVRQAGRVLALARVRRDLAPELGQARAVVRRLAALAAGLGAGLFAALWFFVRRAAQRIAAQHEELLAAHAVLERQNDVLAQINRRKDEFYALCSHDLRSPLLSMHAGCRLLLKGDHALGEQERAVLMRNVASADQALALIDEVLDLARLEAGVESLDTGVVDLRAIVDEVVAAMRLVAAARGVTLEVCAPPGAVAISGDRAKLVRVFSNLLANAVKFSPPGPVTIDLDPRAGDVSVAVIDRGPGIPPEQRATIFHRYAGNSRRAATRSEGTGLGLSIVHDFVAMHGGSVAALPGPDGGSVFTVTLPRVAQPEAAAAS